MLKNIYREQPQSETGINKWKMFFENKSKSGEQLQKGQDKQSSFILWKITSINYSHFTFIYSKYIPYLSERQFNKQWSL